MEVLSYAPNILFVSARCTKPEITIYMELHWQGLWEHYISTADVECTATGRIRCALVNVNFFLYDFCVLKETYKKTFHSTAVHRNMKPIAVPLFSPNLCVVGPTRTHFGVTVPLIQWID